MSLHTEALEEQRITLAAAAATANSTATESSPIATPQENEKVDNIYEPLGTNSFPETVPPT
jgi:hypothetical protein